MLPSFLKQKRCISIETDSTYSAKKNAYCSNTFPLGVNNHQIVGAEILSKQDEALTHRLEQFTTERIIAELQNRGLKFKNIIHDRNHQVPNLIEKVIDNDETDIEQNEIWHVIKSDMKKFSELGKELKKNENITWSSQLSNIKE